MSIVLTSATAVVAVAATSTTTGSFTVTSGEYYVIMVGEGDNNAPTATVSVHAGSAGTGNLQRPTGGRYAPAFAGGCEVWEFSCTGTGSISFDVSQTGFNSLQVAVYKVAGSAGYGSALVFGTGASGTINQVSYTPTQIGSQVLCIGVNQNSGTATVTANAQCTLIGTASLSGMSHIMVYETALTSSLSAVTPGSGTAAQGGQIMFPFEILPAAASSAQPPVLITTQAVNRASYY